MLSRVNWIGESLDVYANNIRRLAGLAEFQGRGLNRMVKLTFVNDFLDLISIDLQQLPRINSMEMGELLLHARALNRKREQELQTDVVAD